MSFDAVRWALAVTPEPVRQDDLPRVNAEALRTLAYLATREVDGYTWVSPQTVAKDRQIARGTVYRHLGALERCGLILKTKASAVLSPTALDRYRAGTKRRPGIWLLAVGQLTAEASTVSPTETHPTVSPTETGTLSATETTDVPVAETTRERTPESQEERAMSSPAYDDLGGHGNPATTRFPKQCHRHQDREHHEPCGACGAARARFEEQIEQQRAARKQRAADERRAESRERWAAIRECRYCDERGYQPSGRVCPRDDDGRHFWMNHPEMVAS